MTWVRGDDPCKRESAWCEHMSQRPQRVTAAVLCRPSFRDSAKAKSERDYRRRATGSVFDARAAGIYVAQNATINSPQIANATVRGSCGATPYSRLVSSLVPA